MRSGMEMDENKQMRVLVYLFSSIDLSPFLLPSKENYSRAGQRCHHA